jgi:hypothetical protein
MLAEAHRADAHQDTQTEFINAIPDFTQTDIAGARHGNGYEYCGPAAVANSLFWLNGNKGDIERLVIKLASKRYMHTDVRQGTHTANILHGVDVMARDMFGGYRRLVYQGWRPHARRFSSGKRIPDYDDLVSNISDHSAVWLNVGWYRYDERDDVYHRVGGHWVTLVGYDKDTFVLHDPSPRAGNSFANEFVQTSLINSGMMVGDSTGLPVPARGYIRLGEGMHIKRNADTAIVDGAVIFNL